MPTHQPIIRRDIQSGSMHFSAMVFGGINWSLAQLKGPEGEAFAEILGTVLEAVGTKRVYAPSPVTFNGTMITPRVLRTIIPLGKDGLLMYRNPEVPADGTALALSGDTGVFSAGGCCVIVVACGEHLLFAHAGRDCVLPRQVILGEEAGRSHESIVDSMMQMLRRYGVNPNEARVWVFWSIRPEEFAHRFDNETHGAYNRGLRDYLRDHNYVFAADEDAVYPDIPAIIVEQFLRCGVRPSGINIDDAYLPGDLPHTRNQDGNRRYLAAIVRN